MVRNLIPVLILAVAPLFAGEGVVLIQKQDDLQSGSSATQKMQIEQDKVALETTDGAKRMGFVYLADSGVIRMINHSDQSYREMTEEEIERLMGGVNEQLAKFQEQMKNMSPQQREMMEKVMGGRMAKMGALPGAQIEPINYRRGDGSTEIGGRPCDWYDGYRREKMVSQVCAADWSTFDLAPSDFAVFQRLAEFITKLAPQMADQIKFGAEDWEARGGFPGIPLENKTFENGKAVQVSTLESVDRQMIDESVYAAPTDYRLQKGLGGR